MCAYDDNNPWHEEVNIMMGLLCSGSGCYVQVGFDDLPSVNEIEWEDLCVAVADVARADGWTFTGGDAHYFLCSVCSARVANGEAVVDVPGPDSEPIGFGPTALFGFFATCIGATGGTFVAALCGIDLTYGAALFGGLGFVAGLVFGAGGLRMSWR